MHHFDELVRHGVAVTPPTRRAARATQIMNLLGLAPDIQEQIVLWPPITAGKDPISERGIRDVVAELEWRKQRGLWKRARQTV